MKLEVGNQNYYLQIFEFFFLIADQDFESINHNKMIKMLLELNKFGLHLDAERILESHKLK